MPENRASRRDDLARIQAALEAAGEVFRVTGDQRKVIASKGRRGPLTLLDRAINERLHQILPRDGEGWLSEESADDPVRLRKRRVWIVDPLDGTREFVEGIPEFCISIGLVEDGTAVAGGIFNPATCELFLGSRETGVMRNGVSARARQLRDPRQAVLLISRQDIASARCPPLARLPFQVRPVGSIAYKLALVAAGLADATWSFTPKHEWDVAGGVALVAAAGGFVASLRNRPITFNRPTPKLDGLAAFAPQESRAISRRLLASWRKPRTQFARLA